MFSQAAAKRVQQLKTNRAVRQSPAEGLVLAIKGVLYDEWFLVSAFHAVACAAIVSGAGNPDAGDLLAGFVQGQKTFVPVPTCLREAGVMACMPRETAQEFARWMASVDRTTIEREVAGMHGAASVADYVKTMDSVHRTLDVATGLHGGDVCCWRGADR